MADGAWTDDLEQLLEQLATNQQLIARFEQNRANAVAPFDLTHHEREAVVTRDLDDFVELGIVDAIEDLPPVLRGERAGGIPGLASGIFDRLKPLIDRIRRTIPGLPDPPIPPPDPGPVPPPGPGPVPRPNPGPTPGPDPPDP